MPANRTDLFQPLDLGFNKSSKCFLSDKYQTCYTDEVAAQLGRVVAPHDAKVDVRLLVVKPSHTKWVVKFYHHMQLNAG